MTPRLGRILSAILFIFIILFLTFGSSSAQEAFTATLSVPDISAFPHLTAYLDVHDPSGAFIHGLSPQDVTLLENDRTVTISDLQELKPGIQLAIAITPGDSFAIRDAMGISRYEYLLQGILAGSWADSSNRQDDYSLLTVGGPQLIHSSDPAALADAIRNYLPDGQNASPGLEVLASALQVVGDVTVRPGMERAILFITPPQDSQVALGLQSIITSAIQQDIHVFVWLVASQEVFDLPETDQLKNLARETHGAFFAFSHDEPVPDLESLMEPLRYIYQLGYDSMVTSPGPQQLAARVSAAGGQVTSTPVSFDVNLQQPEVSLLAPPAEIERDFSSRPTEAATNSGGDLEPGEQILNIRVTFPDGYERPLTNTGLFVDGVLVAENTSSPFSQFIWNLQPYTQSGVHSLYVEATDNLGLSGKSAETSVNIILPTTSQGMFLALAQKRPLVIGAGVLIFASVMLLVLILTGRIRPRPYLSQVGRSLKAGDLTGSSRYRHNGHKNTIPVIAADKKASPSQPQSLLFLKRLLERLPWFKPELKPMPALAYLLPLVGPDEITLPAPLQITAEDVTLGSDPHEAMLVIADPSIEGLHARIHRVNGSFQITDAGSVAGTWLNYKPVPPEGALLEHADIIHLGLVGFRINLTQPGRLRSVVVTLRETEQ